MIRGPQHVATAVANSLPAKGQRKRVSQVLLRQARGERQAVAADDVKKRLLRRAIRRLRRNRRNGRNGLVGADSKADGEQVAAGAASNRATAMASATYSSLVSHRRRRRQDSHGGGGGGGRYRGRAWGGNDERRVLTADAAEAMAARLEDELQQEVGAYISEAAMLCG